MTILLEELGVFLNKALILEYNSSDDAQKTQNKGDSLQQEIVSHWTERGDSKNFRRTAAIEVLKCLPFSQSSMFLPFPSEVLKVLLLHCPIITSVRSTIAPSTRHLWPVSIKMASGRLYRQLFVYCRHTRSRFIPSGNLDNHAPLQTRTFHSLGFCPVCTEMSRTLVKQNTPASADNANTFARLFFTLDGRLEEEDFMNTRLEGLISPEHIDSLDRVRFALQVNLIWRSRANYPDPSTDKQSETVEYIGNCIFNALIRNSECSVPENIRNWQHRLINLVNPSTLSADNYTCIICYEDYGSIDAMGNTRHPCSFCCGHGVLCTPCAISILGTNYGNLQGSKCPYRCELPSVAQLENNSNRETEPTEYMNMIIDLAKRHPEAFVLDEDMN